MMKTIILTLILITVCQLTGCLPTRKEYLESQKVIGVYRVKEGSNLLELRVDNSFTLLNPKGNFTPIFVQCNYASKGTWSFVDENVLELTSEDNYIKQDGFNYVLDKKNKYSSDSLYILINFPSDFIDDYSTKYNPINFQFYFNSNVSKSIETDKTYIVLSKNKHLGESTNINEITFILKAKASGSIYKSRVSFKMFEEIIDTGKYNYLTITLPHIDRCFLEFEPYYKELIYIKNRNQLFWQGKIWQKQ